jgi:hypothetical protein
VTPIAALVLLGLQSQLYYSPWLVVERAAKDFPWHRDEKERVAAEAARERLTSLEERLARLLTTAPIEVQREGLSLTASRRFKFVLRCCWRRGASFSAL